MLNSCVCLFVMLAATAPSSQAEEGVPSGDIAPAADRVLRAMSKFLTAMPSFAFTADVAFDAVEPGDETISVLRRSEVCVSRPNRLRVDSTGSQGVLRTVSYNRGKLAVVDYDAGVYSTVDVPDTIDAMLDHLFEKYGMSMPAADFLFSDPRQVLTEGATSARYLGSYELRGQPCHHLAVRQEAIDYQLWVAAGDEPLPLRMLVSYKLLPAKPRFQVDFSNWRRPLVDPTDARFAPEIPEDAEEVEMTPTPDIDVSATELPE